MPEKPLNEEITALCEQFIRCAADMGQEGEPQHVERVRSFQADFGSFLKRYPDQSIGTFAASLSQRGVPHGQALLDVVTLNNLYRESEGPAPHQLFRDGTAALEAGDNEQAIELLSQVIASLDSPQDVDSFWTFKPFEAFSNRGLACKRLGHLELAARDYTRALERSPSRPAVLLMRADVHYLQQDYPRAAEDAERALEIDPESSLGWYNLACYQALAGREQEAIDALATLLEKFPAEAAGVRQDADFESLQELPAFRALVE